MEYYEIMKLNDEQKKKIEKILEVLEFENKISQIIEFAFQLPVEGYLHDGDKSALYSFSDLQRNEIEVRLMTYSRSMVPELDYPEEVFAEGWQKLQVLLTEDKQVLRNLDEFIKLFKGDVGNIDKLIEEIESVKEMLLLRKIADREGMFV